MTARFCDRCGGRMDDADTRGAASGTSAVSASTANRGGGLVSAGAGSSDAHTPDAGFAAHTADVSVGVGTDAHTAGARVGADARGAGAYAAATAASDDATHRQCQAARRLEPPRYCARCGRRMVVQISPGGWTARCAEHGMTSHLG